MFLFCAYIKERCPPTKPLIICELNTHRATYFNCLYFLHHIYYNKLIGTMTREKHIIDSSNFFMALHKAVEKDELDKKRKYKKMAKDVSSKFRQGNHLTNKLKEQGFS